MSEIGDTTKVDGYKKFLYLVIGSIGTAALSVINDPAGKEAANQGITLATNLIPVASGVIGTIVQGIVDIFKLKSEATVKAAEKTSTPMFDNPEYGKRQISQAEILAKQTIPTIQIKPDFPNEVSQNLEIMTKLVSSDEGAFQYLMDTIGETIDREFQRWITASLQPIEALQKVVSQYLNIDLTPADCEAIIANKNLATILHSYADKTILASFYTAHKAGTLGAGVWDKLKDRAYFYARKNVIDTSASKAMSEDLTISREGMAAFGLNDYTIKTAIKSGKGIMYINIGGSPRNFNGFALAGVDTETMKSL